MLDDYPALKVFQIGLGLSFCFDMSNIKTMIDSIPLHAHLEVIEITTMHKGWVPPPDLVRQTIDEKLGERGMVARLLVSTKWEINMPTYAYKHVSSMG